MLLTKLVTTVCHIKNLRVFPNLPDEEHRSHVSQASYANQYRLTIHLFYFWGSYCVIFALC